MKVSQQELRAEGPLTVEPAGKYYAVTMPHLSLHEPDGSYTDFGIFAINAIPGDKPGEWKITVATPTPITGYNAAKKPELRITLGGQSFNGIWNEKNVSLSKLDAEYKNIVVEQPLEGYTMKTPKATLSYNLTPGPNGKTLSGPARYELTNIEVAKAGETAVSKIGRIVMDMNIRDYDPAKAREYQKKIAALSATAKKSADGKIPDEQAHGIITSLFDFMATAWDGFDSKITATDIDLSRPAKAGEPAGRLQLKQVSSAFGLDGFRSNSVTMRVAFGYDALAFAPAPVGFTETVPSRINFDVTFNKIPFRELTDAANKAMQSAGDTPESKRAAGLQAASVIPQLLTAAGAYAQITQSFIANNTYNATIDGKANANLKALMGADGKARIEVAGLDQLMTYLQTAIKDPKTDAAAKAQMQKTMLSLTVFQGFGQQGKNTAGQATRIYDVELNEQGKIMLNGMDLSALQALAGAARKASAPAEPKKP
jgi:hypothetical protein